MFPLAAAAAGGGDDALPSILLLLAFVLVAAKLSGELFERIGLPAVVGELAVGMLLGNLTLAGGPSLDFLAHSETFTVLAELALGMMPRGEVGLIFAGIGATLVLGGRPVIDSGTYAAAVFMVAATTVATPPLLLWSIRRSSPQAATRAALETR